MTLCVGANETLCQEFNLLAPKDLYLGNFSEQILPALVMTL